MPCLVSWLNKRKRIISTLSGREEVHLWSAQSDAKSSKRVSLGCLGWRCESSYWHFWLSLDGDQVWSSYVSFYLPQLKSLTDIGAWIKQRRRQVYWESECHQAFQKLFRTGNISCLSSTADFYWELMGFLCDDVIWGDSAIRWKSANQLVQEVFRAGVSG